MAAPQLVGDGIAFNQLLSTNTWSHYLTWILQVMPLFFLVGGYANAASWRSARGRNESYGAWLRARLRRLVLPVLPLLAVWGVGAYAMFSIGLDPDLIRRGSQAALVPLWFLATYLVVVALTPVTLRAWDRFGWGSLAGGRGPGRAHGRALSWLWLPRRRLSQLCVRLGNGAWSRLRLGRLAVGRRSPGV